VTRQLQCTTRYANVGTKTRSRRRPGSARLSLGCFSFVHKISIRIGRASRLVEHVTGEGSPCCRS
jgi:hypothetical protein